MGFGSARKGRRRYVKEIRYCARKNECDHVFLFFSPTEWKADQFLSLFGRGMKGGLSPFRLMVHSLGFRFASLSLFFFSSTILNFLLDAEIRTQMGGTFFLSFRLRNRESAAPSARPSPTHRGKSLCGRAKFE